MVVSSCDKHIVHSIGTNEGNVVIVARAGVEADGNLVRNPPANWLEACAILGLDV